MNDQQRKMENIVSLAKRRGFIYPGSDVYGGLSGTWDYGPLGVVLKRNIMQLWWKMFVEDREDMHGVDAAILMNQKVWQASGHVDTFTDPLIECLNCRSRFRTDKILNVSAYSDFLKIASKVIKDRRLNLISGIDDLESIIEYYGTLKNAGKVDFKEIREEAASLDMLEKDFLLSEKFCGFFPSYYLGKIQDKHCDNCGEISWGESRNFNMMFKTNVGPVDDESSVSYLRPETAQGIFTNYKNVVDTFYPDMPFGLAQQGKAFRNEISPRDFIFRSREFEQMEIEYFVDPAAWEASFEHWRQQVWKWTQALGLSDERVHELEVPETDRAHYSKRTIDFEYDFPIGREELLGLAYRTDFDLMNIQNSSGKNMEYTVKGTNTKFVPHVIEPSFGVERSLMAVLSEAYTEDQVNGEARTFLKLPHHLAPIRYAVSPLVRNKPELVEKAREIYSQLKARYGAVAWDDNGNIGKRYRRQDEIGTPFCVVVDFQTLEDGTMTVRDRDTTEQRRTTIDELLAA